MTTTETRACMTSKAGKPDTVRTIFGSCRVLVADDEHLQASELAALARELGHSVVGVAADGAQAIEMGRELKPELALLDIRMPKVSGIDAAAQLHRELKVPSVIVSAFSDEEHVGKIQAGGADSGVYGYLLKPVSREELRVTIGVARQRAAVDGENEDRIEQLGKNLVQRRVVEQAKWILVEKFKLTEAQAHEKLQKIARDKRKLLIDVAQALIDAGNVE